MMTMTLGHFVTLTSHSLTLFTLAAIALALLKHNDTLLGTAF